MRILVALCLLIVLSGPARGLDGLVECPEGNEALARVTHTPYGYPLTETFAIGTGGRLLEVPIGHLSPWPSPRIYRMQPTPGLQGFEFSFWMPDGRMQEIDTWLNVWSRPCEAGRSQADAEHYIVDVKYIPLDTNTWYGRMRFADDFVLANMKKQFDFETEVQKTIHGKMVEYHFDNYPRSLFLSSSDAPFDAVVSCDKITKLPNVGCSGGIRFHGDDYALHILIPRDSVHDLESAAKLARRLIGEWRQGAVAE